MPLGQFIKSGLKEGIENLPEQAIKAESVPNVLAKKGIKAEELEFSKMGLPTEGKVTKADLAEAESKRQDVFDVVETDSGYQSYSLKAGKANPTYKEKVYTFRQEEPSADDGYLGIEELRDLAQRGDLPGLRGSSRYTSSHFPEVQDYLFHTRTFDDTWGTNKVRVLQELQSDLHQQGRQFGYDDGTTLAEADKAQLRHWLDAAGSDEHAKAAGYKDFAELDNTVVNLVNKSKAGEVDDYDQAARELLEDNTDKPPVSPLEKSWTRKAIEREVASAVEEGREQLAIPIAGPDIKNLVRGEGVQKVYETTVLNTAKKVAKSQGMKFEVVAKGGKAIEDLTEIKRLLDAGDEAGAKALSQKKFRRSVVLLQDIKNGVPLHEIMEVRGFDPGRTAPNISDPSLATMLSKNLDKMADPTTRDFHGPDLAENLVQDTALAMEKKWIPKAEGMELLRLFNEVEQGTKTVEEAKAFIHGTKVMQDDYAVISFGERTPQFALYSSGPTGAFAVYEALKLGASEDEVKQGMLDAGYDEADYAEFYNQATKIAQGVAAGIPEEEIRATLEKAEPTVVGEESTPLTPVDNYWTESEVLKLQPAYKSLQDMQKSQERQRAFARITSEDELSAQDLLKHAQVISPAMASMSTQVSGFFGNEANKQIAAEANQAMIQRIVNLLQKKINKPVEFKNGGYVVQTEQGEVPVDTTFWQSMEGVGGETVGNLAGAIAGAKAGAKVPTVNPYAKGLAIIGGSVLGAAGGGIIGTELDYLQSSIALSEDLDAQVAGMKALQAAEISVLADLGIIGGAQVAKGAWTTAIRAKDFVAAGNPEGAVKALHDSLYVTEDEAREAVERLGRLSDVPGKLPAEQQIAAVALTQPGMEGLVGAATKLDVATSMALSKSIDARAKDLLKTTAEFAPDRIPRLIKEDLANYTADVKQFYHGVKEQAAKSSKAGNFEFDYDKLVLDPVLERIEKDLVPGPVLEKFSFQARKIRAMSDSRTFTDLLDMRQLVNEFMYNKNLRNAKGYGELATVKSNIDKAIADGAKVAVENPTQWLKDYSLANSQYSAMKGLEKNVIVKLMNRPGINPSLVTKSLAKYITALDGTFNEVMTKLPKNLRPGIEGSVMNTLAEKYTAGVTDGVRATHFPKLADDLSKITFTTPEMRKLKVAVMEMAEVFRNDIPLSQAAGQITIPGFQSFLTTDPVVRAQFEVASSVFNAVRKFKPTTKGRETALVLKTAEVLEKPLNSKAVRELMEEAGDRVNITAEVQKLANEAAKAQAKGLDKDTTKVVLFGDGPVLSFKGTGKRTSVPQHRIATHEIVETVAEAEGINLANKKALDQALKARGYSVVQIGTGKVRRIK
jgi:hypothetical protein